MSVLISDEKLDELVRLLEEARAETIKLEASRAELLAVLKRIQAHGYFRDTDRAMVDDAIAQAEGKAPLTPVGDPNDEGGYQG